MGSVYFIQAVTGGPIKIGYSGEVAGRLPSLQTGSAIKLVVLCTVEGTRATEKALHHVFADDAMEGEWFLPSEAIRAKVKELGGEVLEARAWSVEDRATSQPTLTRGGMAVQARLNELGQTQKWLVDQINDVRASRGIKGRAGMATLWRWMSGFSLIGVRDAVLIQRILGVPATRWSQYDDVEPRVRVTAA